MEFLNVTKPENKNFPVGKTGIFLFLRSWSCLNQVSESGWQICRFNLSMSNKQKMLGDRQMVKSLINQGSWSKAIIKSHKFSKNH